MCRSSSKTLMTLLLLILDGDQRGLRVGLSTRRTVKTFMIHTLKLILGPESLTAQCTRSHANLYDHQLVI